MLHSVLAHAGGVRVHYLHGPELLASSEARLRGMVERGGGSIRFHAIAPADVAGFPSQHRFTPAMWYRLFLPELLPDADQVLYLDADALAMDALAPLWATDLEGHWVAAVTNVFEPWSAGRPAALGLPGPEAYFNSGVLLFNLAEMRRDGRGEALRRLVRERGDELLWPDQDALNLVLGERRLALHPRWNCMNSVLEFDAAREVFGAAAVEEARRAPGIRHFEGPDANKPWHLLCQAPGREAYFAHRRATPWPRARRVGVTPRNLLVRAARAVRA
jgi:UDP-glucose:(glucosyl)LPS alpha-1,3-glucosyltransferase/UDP-D-galactose:(glucosyl)LPS alpha-1,3-D-galactosyltransferase/UDP-glucose:(galactosyl)LPS alpha-1,2-glucosyltransferase